MSESERASAKRSKKCPERLQAIKKSRVSRFVVTSTLTRRAINCLLRPIGLAFAPLTARRPLPEGEAFAGELFKVTHSVLGQFEFAALFCRVRELSVLTTEFIIPIRFNSRFRYGSRE